MSDIQRIKEAFAEEREKLSKLSWPQKIGYIFSYYKFPIIITIAVVTILSILLYHYVANNKERLLIGMFINTSVNEEGYDVVSDGFFEYLDGDPSKEMVRVLENNIVDYTLQQNDEFSTGQRLKVIAMITIQELDFIISDESAIQSYGPEDGLRNLSDFLPSDLYEELEAYMLTTTSVATGETYPVAIDISHTPYAQKYELSTSPSYLAFFDLSPRTDNSLAFLRYFLSLE